MTHKIATIERRSYPRIRPIKPIKIGGGIEGQLIDISYGGMAFQSSYLMNKNKFNITLELAHEPLELEVSILWQSQVASEGKYLYGIKINRLDERKSRIIARYIMSEQYERFTYNVTDVKSKKAILKFCFKLKKYIYGLDDLEKAISSRSICEENAAKKLANLTDAIVLDGEHLKNELNNKLIYKKIKEEFRNLISPWAFKSQIVKRSYDKPNGYPGDYQTLEVIYNNQIVSNEKGIGYYYDIYFLRNPYAVAVRNRKNFIKEVVHNLIITKTGEVRILNLASGSCREIREIFADNARKYVINRISISCLDWDDNALSFSKNELSNLPSNINISFINEDILNYAKDVSFFEKHGQFDLIYSIGLADYLPDRVNKKIIQNSYAGLKDDGRFIIAHKNREITFSHLPPEWFCDWVFIPRNEEELLEIVRSIELPNSECTLDRDNTGDMFFITIKKLSTNKPQSQILNKYVSTAIRK